jgi:hypothetical protein
MIKRVTMVSMLSVRLFMSENDMFYSDMKVANESFKKPVIGALSIALKNNLDLIVSYIVLPLYQSLIISIALTMNI